MNRDQISRFASRGAAVASETQGTLVRFRGETLRKRISPTAPTLDLDEGGFSPRQQWKLRFPASVLPVPAALEKVVEISSGRTFVLTGVIPAGVNALSAEHVATAEWQ